MIIRKLITTALAFALLAVIGAVPDAMAQTIKLGTLAPKGSPWHEAIMDMAAEWEEASNGAIRVRVYPGGIAGDETDMIRKMRIGQLHAASLTGSGLASVANEIQSLQMPMMFRSDDELDFVRDAMAAELSSALEARGFKLLHWADAGWVYFFTQSPVIRPDDLKSQKLFAWAGETAIIEAWKGAGYKPVPLAATDIFTGLQSGLITAIPTTPIAALSFQWFGLADNMTQMKWAPLVGGTVISMQMWNRIPAELRGDFAQIALDAAANYMSTIRALDLEAIEVMKEHGLKVHPVPEAVVAEWTERVKRLAYPKIIGAIVPRESVARVERILAEYRARQAGGQ